MLKNPWCTAIKLKRFYIKTEKICEMISSDAMPDSIKLNWKGK